MRIAVALAVVFAVSLLAGCGDAETKASTDTSDDKIVLGYVGWDESVAMAALTKVLLEEKLGYKNVELRESEPDDVYGQMADGEVDAFQGVWLPNHYSYINEHPGKISVLRSWLDGTTRQGIAVPDYVGIRSVEDLEKSGIDTLIGPRPGAAAVVSDVPLGVLARFGVAADLTYPSADAMLKEVDRRYKAREKFAFVAWTPHWMNKEYDFTYLEDPKGRMAGLIRPMDIHTAVVKDFSDRDPKAYALLNALELGEYEVVDLEEEIRGADSPVEGARRWVGDHEDRASVWVKAAKKGSSD